MFAQLLPGLRELRAPLAAGYLWLLALWIALEPVIPDESRGVLESLERFEQRAGPLSLAAALTFAAYLLGSLSAAVPLRRFTQQALKEATWNFVAGPEVLKAIVKQRSFDVVHEDLEQSYTRLRLDGRQDRMSLSTRGAAALWELLETRVSLMTDERRRELLPLAEAVATNDGAEWIRSLAVGDVADWPRSLREQHRGLVREQRERRDAALNEQDRIRRRDTASHEDQERVRKAVQRARDDGRAIEREFRRTLRLKNGAEDIDSLLVQYLGEQVVEEGEALRTRLLGKEPEIWSKVDRLLAEAELRDAIVLPLLGLAAALGWRGPWWSSAIAVAAAIALAFQAAVREKQSNDALVEALRVARVRSPTLDALGPEEGERPADVAGRAVDEEPTGRLGTT